jgi:predicted secreted hydrolase
LPLKNCYATIFSILEDNKFRCEVHPFCITKTNKDRLELKIREIRLSESGNNIMIDTGGKCKLKLQFSAKNRLLHGDKGVIKMDDRGYSNYYSIVDTSVKGYLNDKEIKGFVWFDHQWGDWWFDRDCWNWFGILLDNKVQIMIFNFYDKNRKQITPTITIKEGNKQRILNKLKIKELGYWTSPKTKTRYPVKWLLEFDKARLIVASSNNNQEIKSLGTYLWEGSCEVNGSYKGRKIKGKGFMELTGYHHFIKGDFCEEYKRV